MSKTVVAKTGKRTEAEVMQMLNDPMSWVMAQSVEEGDCLVWTGRLGDGRAPVVALPSVHPKQPGAKLATSTVARALWEVTTGKRVPPGKLLYRKCLSGLCVLPEHGCVGTMAKLASLRKAHGLTRASMSKRIKNTAYAINNRAVLNMDDARAIRARKPDGRGVGQAKAISAEYGISEAHVYRIWREQVWAEATAPSPFSGLFTGLMNSRRAA